MKKTIIIFGLLIMSLFFLASCTNSQNTLTPKTAVKYICPDNTAVDNPSSCKNDNLKESNNGVKCIELCKPGETMCDGKIKQACASNGCSWVVVGESNECQILCGKDLDCFDNNDCTTDTCSSSKCENTRKLFCNS